MQQSTAKIYFDAGSLVEARITKSPMQTGWVAEVKQRGGHGYLAIELQRGGVRVHRSIDAAYSTLNQIGFKRALVLGGH